MATPTQEEIIAAAIRALEDVPEGISTGVLLKKLKVIPDITLGGAAIHSALLQYAHSPGALICQPGRGMFLHTKFRGAQPPPQPSTLPPETEFYKPFAEFLETELQECTKAIPVGGAKLGGLFGTPDVIGIWGSREGDVIHVPIEVVSAEVKVSTDGLVKAFGQACSYKLFSHRVYIVVPKTASKPDLVQLDALCMVLGIGLILFDPSSPTSPAFEIKARAARHEPDAWYMNEKLRHLREDLLD